MPLPAGPVLKIEEDGTIIILQEIRRITPDTRLHKEFLADLAQKGGIKIF